MGILVSSYYIDTVPSLAFKILHFLIKLIVLIFRLEISLMKENFSLLSHFFKSSVSRLAAKQFLQKLEEKRILLVLSVSNFFPCNFLLLTFSNFRFSHFVTLIN